MKKYICLICLLSTNHIFAQTNNESLGNGGLYWCDDGLGFGYNCNGLAAGSSITSGDRNVFIGDNAGMSVTSGSYNTFMGESAGLNQTSASDNTFIGHQAGFSVTTGQDNTFIGKRAGFSNTDTDNTFIGADAGYFNTNGSDNTFIGEQSGYFTTTGDDNTFIGEDAGYSNTTGENNVAIGDTALRMNETGLYNTAVGHEAGYDNENASRNTSVGNFAGGDIGEGQGNTMLGANAGSNTEHANFNTFVGVFSGWDNNRTNNTNNANRNTGLGSFSGYNNREGEDNVWVGAFASSGTWGASAGLEDDMFTTCDAFCSPSNAGSGDTTIYRTTVLGASTTVRENDGVAIGYRARTAGNSAISIGSFADSNNTAADFSITIGAQASTVHNQSIVLGYQTVSHAAFTATIGNANTISWDPNTDAVTTLGTATYRFEDVFSNKLSVNALTTTPAEIDLFADAGTADDDKWTISAADGGNFSISSFATGADVNVFSIANTGDAVIAGDLALNSDRRLKTNINTFENALETVSQLEGKTYNWKDKSRAKGEHIGFIAQEIEQVLPNLVSSDKTGIKSVNYQGVVPVLVNALNELNMQVKKQELQAEKQQQHAKKQDQMILQLQDLIEQQQALIIKLSQ